MKYLGNPYEKGNSQEIKAFKIQQANANVLGAGIFVKLDQVDTEGDTVAVFNGTGVPVGVTGWDPASIIGDKGRGVKSVVMEGLRVWVVYTGTTATTGSLVHIQADGTLSDTDATFGSFLVIEPPQAVLDWDNTEKQGICINLKGVN